MAIPEANLPHIKRIDQIKQAIIDESMAVHRGERLDKFKENYRRLISAGSHPIEQTEPSIDDKALPISSDSEKNN